MSVLTKIGHVLKVVFVDGDKVAVAVEPLIGFLLPGWSTLFDLVANSIANAEGSLGEGSLGEGSLGQQKKALARQTAEQMFQRYEQISGNTVDRDAFIDGVVMALNATSSKES